MTSKTFTSCASWLRHKFADVPIVGHLVYCTWAAHKATLKEMVVILLFSTATFWLTAAILMGWEASRTLGYLLVLHSTVKSGELFIFTVGFLGPILLIAGEDKETESQFPGRLWHLLAFVLLAFIATAFHSQVKSAQLHKQLVQSDMNFLFNASIVLAVCAIFLRYLAMLYRKTTFRPKVEIKDQEVNWVADYAEHLGSSMTKQTTPDSQS